MTCKEHFDHLIVFFFLKEDHLIVESDSILIYMIFDNFKFNENIPILVHHIRKLPKNKLVVGFIISVGSEDLTEYGVIIRIDNFSILSSITHIGL